MNRKMKAFWISLFLLIAVIAAVHAESADIEVEVTFGQTAARSMLAMINDFRTGPDAWYWNEDNTQKIVCTNLQPLVYDYDLEKAAMQRAAEVAISFSHTRPDGSRCFTAFPSGWNACGENIAAGYGTAQAAFIGWREDDDNYSGQGHRRNMLNADFNCIGIGHATRNGTDYWTHALAFRSSPNTSATSASETNTVVMVTVAYDRVTDVSAANATLQIGETINYPAITFKLTGTWGSRVPYRSAQAPVWTASDPAKVSLGATSFTGLAAGEVTLTTSVFDKAVSSKVTIQPKDIATAEISLQAENLIYTGKAQKPAVSVKDGNKTLTEGTDYTVAYTDNVNASSAAAVKVSGIGNYTGTKSLTFSIGKAPLTVKAKDKTISYGKAPANDGVEYTGFVNGEGASVLGGTLKYAYTYEQYGDIGLYAISPSGLTSGNYAISYTKGTLTVERKQTGLTWENTVLTYTGHPQAPTAVVTGTVNQDEITATVTGAMTDAGTYTATVVDLTGEKAFNYTLPTDVTTEFEIQKAVPVVTPPVPKTGLIRNGTPQQLISAGSTTGGIMKYSLEKDGEYTVDLPSAIEAGIYDVWYRVDGDDNYQDVAPKSVTAVINPEAVSEVTVNGGVYKLNENTASLKKAASGTAKALIVADRVAANGKTYKVTAIGDNACKGMSRLAQVRIGKYVTKIGKNAFSGCKALKTVAGGGAVTALGDSAFASCVKLTSVPAFAKLQTIGANAFKSCKALPKITLSAKVKSIGKNAFYGCAKLKSIVIKTKLLKDKSVGSGAFKGIYKKPIVTCPKGMAKTYKKLLQKKGMPKKAVYK